MVVKRKISLIMALLLPVLMLTGCGNKAGQASAGTTKPADVNEPVTTDPTADETENVLNGKRVIFIGNSHTYYSRCVVDKGQTTSVESRMNDMGIFYQICKANGVDVSVTNYTFGMHQLSDFYSGSCAANRGHDGHDHMADFADFNYDYVIIQQGAKETADLKNDVQKMLEPFKAANPDVKCIFLMHLKPYTDNYSWIPQVDGLEEIGVTVVNWGEMVDGIIKGTLTVPGTEQTFNLNSFIISQSSSDGYHPNLLSGYITALMTYCAITGEKAEGQVCEFTTGSQLGAAEIANFRSKYYTYDPLTNFDEILQTKSEMVGIQKLIDEFLSK